MPALPLVPARLAFSADGTPYSATYGVVYHSAEGGLAQARHVFLAGNGLPARWAGRGRFVILETGFGFGLNFLAPWAAWRADPQHCGRLHYVAAEKHPFVARFYLVAIRLQGHQADGRRGRLGQLRFRFFCYIGTSRKLDLLGCQFHGERQAGWETAFFTVGLRQ